MKYLLAIGILISLLTNCTNKPQEKPDQAISNQEQVYLKKGQTIAAATFATLSTNLQKAIQEGGISNAISYCNLAASPLVDSLEQVYQASIKRTALKVRNPKNTPTPAEVQQLQQYEEQLEAGQDLKPVLNQFEEQIIFHAPIRIMPLCEQCHGKVGSTLKAENHQLIQSLYPSDQAVDYQTGDLRGMWSISFSAAPSK